MDYLLPFAAIAWTALIITVGFFAGRASNTDRRDAFASMNDFRKAMSKREAVAEFIAPGERAEIIRLDPEIAPCGHRLGLCHGCEYAGRYVLSSGR